MKILDRYIIKSYFLRLIGVFAICFIIFIIQTFWLYVDELAGKGIDIFTIGKFFIYFSPKLVPLVLPLSVLLASLMTYGTLSENSEFIAMKSNGISIVRTMLGLLIFHVFLGIGTFYFSNYIVTYGELKSYNLRKNLAKLKPTLAIREGMFNNIGDMNIKVNRKYGDNEQYLEDIILHKINFDDEINRIVIKAETGEITSNNENYLQLFLKNGNRYEEVIAEDAASKQKYPHTKVYFEEYLLNIDISEFNNIDLNEENYRSTYKMQKISQLKTSIDTLKTNFERDKELFSNSVTNSHPLKRLPNLDNNKLTDINKPIFDFMKSKENYDIINVLQNSENEVDILLRQINNKKKSYFLQQKLINLHTLAINEKYTLIFGCIFLFLIGASIGTIIRRGGIGLPLVLSISIFLTYHYIGVFGKNAAEDSTINPYLGSWISTLVIAPFAIYLTRIISLDRGFNFINLDRFLIFFRRLYKKK